MNFIANLLSNAATTVADAGSNACILWFVDEPECPEDLIK